MTFDDADQTGIDGKTTWPRQRRSGQGMSDGCRRVRPRPRRNYAELTSSKPPRLLQTPTDERRTGQRSMPWSDAERAVAELIDALNAEPETAEGRA